MDELQPAWVYAALAACVICTLVCTIVAAFVWLQTRTDVSDVRAIVARIEAQQASFERHVLHARDLAPLHEKINRVAEEQAETRGELTEVARMLREQLRILQTARGGA